MKTNKQIFLGNLPRKIYKGKECIDWINSVGEKVKFIYDDIEGYIQIINCNSTTQEIIIQYNEVEYKMAIRSFIEGRFGKLLGKHTKEFRYEIGQFLNNNKKDLIIIGREYRSKEKIRKNNKKCIENEKWYKYHCNKCGVELWIKESGLTRMIQCACCGANPKIIVEGINDIPTVAPWMVKYFQGGYDEAKLYSKASNQRIYPICPDCGRVKDSSIGINTIYMNKSFGCYCHDGISYPEKFMFNTLEKLLDTNFIWQYTKSNNDWCDKYKYDFYFEYNDEQYIIETHGEQHYTGGFERIKTNKYVKTLEETQEIDMVKKELALRNGIKEENYIVIDCRESSLDWIKQNILESNLNRLFDLSKIDWLNIEELSVTNLVKIACDYKRNNPELTTTEIGKIMKLGNHTISRYLSTGNELGWCEYSAQNEWDKLHSRLNKYGYSVEIFKDGVSLGTFPTGAELERQSEKLFGVKLHAWNILAVCKGERGSHWGFTFKFANK
jgi:hypothetical protein